MSPDFPRKPCLRIRALSTAVAACFAATPAWSLPTAPTVVNGTATFNQVGNALTVTNSNNAIINWQKFGISAGELTRFIQSSASSAVLNRVVGGDLSAIYGSLQSNGRVWLVNPAGILVGAGGTIDTAAFVASTLALRDSDFLAGKLTFSGPGGNLINQGTITTPSGGSVYLVGANVSNEGVITTPKGETILAAGQTVNLVDTATPGVKVEITGSEGNVTNLGTIAAEAGRIGMAGVIVRNSGSLNAASAIEEGGKVFLRASQDTYVNGSGRIVATGTTGGQVEVLGNRVAVMDNASIDASGTNGGGRVMVGGDFQGRNPDVRNSQITYFGPDASIRANAEKVGDGGTVIVWADDTTRAYGSIEARGGADGGNGGFVEVSGKRYLDYQGLTDTRAPNGRSGTLLLDPEDITVYQTTTDSGGQWSYPSAAIFDSYGGPATLGWATINSNLSLGTVKLQSGTYGGSGGNITFTPGTYVSSYGGALDLRAYNGGWGGDINLGGAYINLAGDFYAFAGWDGAGSSVTAGVGNLNVGGTTIQANTINLIAGNTVQINNSTLAATGAGSNAIGLGGKYGVFASGTSMSAANGSVLINSAYGGIYLGSSSITSGYGGGTAIDLTAPGGSIGVGNLSATGGGNVSVNARYQILDDNGTWVPNISTNGGAITLTSTNGLGGYGGPIGGIAISLDTAGAPGALSATVGTGYGGAPFGGISIRHVGNAPGSVNLADYAATPSSNFIDFKASGDINLTASHSFNSYGGAIKIGAGGNLTANGANFSGNPSELGLYAGNTLTVNQSLSVTNTAGAYYPFLGLIAGTTINVNASLQSAGDIGIVAGITPDKLDQLDTVQGPSDLARFLVSTGGTININAPISAGDSIGMMAGNINLAGSNASLWAYYDMFGVVGGDITLSNGASIETGYDVYLGLLGPTSTLYLNKTAGLASSYIVADIESGSPTSINLAFPSRSSGGIVIDGVETTVSTAGGSGLFVLNHSTPATPGYGLEIYYGMKQLDAGVSNTLVNTLTGSTDLNTDPGISLSQFTRGDTTLPGSDQTAGGGEDEFGGKGAENGDGGGTKPGGRNRGNKKVSQCSKG